MNFLIFSIALIPPIIYSIGNILDKKLVHMGGNSSPTVIVTISSLLSVLVIPFIYIFFKINIPFIPHLFLMIFSGTLTVLSVFLYLKALEGESVFSVAPALQLTPVFSYFLGFFVFKEYISAVVLVGCLLIIIGALFLTVKIENIGNSKKFNFKIFLITSGSSLALAVSGAMFKFFAKNYGYWTVQFFEYIGLLLVGIFLFSFCSKVRNKIFDIFLKKEKRSFLFLNLYTEGVMVLGDLTLNFVVLIIPLVIAYSFNALQPMFLLLLGLFLRLLFKNRKIYLETGDFNNKIFFYVFIITIGAFIIATLS